MVGETPFNRGRNCDYHYSGDGMVKPLGKGERSLVGKIHLERRIGKEVISTMIATIWKISKLAIFVEAGSNTFIITFTIHADKQRV